MSSHALGEVERTADHVLVITHGRLVRSCDVATLRAEVRVEARVRTPDVQRLCAALDSAGHAYVEDGGELLIAAPPERVGEIAAAHAVVLHELTASGGLEDAFFAVVDSSGAGQAPAPLEEAAP